MHTAAVVPEMVCRSGMGGSVVGQSGYTVVGWKCVDALVGAVDVGVGNGVAPTGLNVGDAAAPVVDADASLC